MKFLTNQFLVATPQLDSTDFERAVIYICGHSPDEVVGVTINREIGVSVASLIEKIDLKLSEKFYHKRSKVHSGGPLKVETGFILHTPIGRYKSSLTVSDDIGLTTSKDILEAVSKGEGPKKILVALGYSEWSVSQLEKEIMNYDWLVAPFDEKILFDAPYTEKWRLAMESAGISQPFRMTSEIGHA